MSDTNTAPQSQENISENIDTVPPKDPRSQDIYELDAMIDTLEEKLDKVMRAYADSENRAKRAEKERSDAMRYGASKMARDLLDVADNMNRAASLVTTEQKEQFKDIFDGIALTEQSLIQTFQRHDIVRVETDGVKFDPNQHEAISQIPVPNKETGDIIDVLRHGYKMGDRLLRPAQVIVCA